MTPEPDAPFVCRNCRRERTGEKADAAGWCARCRAALVRRSTLPARVAGVLAGVLLVVLLGWTGMLASQRFFVVWLAVAVGLAWVVFKVARRAAFEVYRSRGVSAPPEG